VLNRPIKYRTSEKQMLSFLIDGGQMGAAIRACDWSETKLGAPAGWPTPLKTLVSVVLGSNQPMFVAWGVEQTLFYNDAYAVILADKHPEALGQPFMQVWAEIEADLTPIVEQAYAGLPVHMDDITLMMQRRVLREVSATNQTMTPWNCSSGSATRFSISALILPSFGQRPI
jgi:hypothetical protein